MVEHLSEELKTRRKQLVASRKEEQEKIEKAKQEAERANQRTNNTRGGRGRRGRRGRGGRGQRQAQQTTTRNREGHQPIIIESEDEADGGQVYVGLVEEEVETEDLSDSTRSSDSDVHFYTDSDEDGDGVSGDPDAYYGGYGHCYRCGHRGHWANGCPFR